MIIDQAATLLQAMANAGADPDADYAPGGFAYGQLTGNLVMLDHKGASIAAAVFMNRRLADSFADEAHSKLAGMTTEASVEIFQPRHPLTESPIYIVAVSAGDLCLQSQS